MSALNVMLFGTGSNVVVTAGLARGVFARHGLTLDIAYTQGSEMLCEALRTGGCDIGVLAADDVVYEVERRGLDFFLFMGIHAGLLSLMTRPEITTLGALAGRRFGVDDTASGFVLLARQILRDHGLAESGYTLVKAKGMNLRAQALENGEIDAALLSPPFTLRLRDRGFRLLGDHPRLGDEARGGADDLRARLPRESRLDARPEEPRGGGGPSRPGVQARAGHRPPDLRPARRFRRRRSLSRGRHR